MISVFQEQSMLLYGILAVLVVLTFLAVGIYSRLGTLIDQQRVPKPKLSGGWHVAEPQARQAGDPIGAFTQGRGSHSG